MSADINYYGNARYYVRRETALAKTNNRLIEKARFVSHCEVAELSYEYSIPDLRLMPQINGELLYTPTFFSKSHPKTPASSGNWRSIQKETEKILKTFWVFSSVK